MRVWIATRGGSALVESEDARLSAFDHGVTVGDGVFETVKVVEGSPLALTRHLHRLERSCSVLGLEAPDWSTIRDAVSSVIASDPLASRLGRLRITHTGGAGPLASDREPGEGTTIVAISVMQPWPATTSAVMVPWVRNERSPITGAKSTSYAENVVALQWAKKSGFSEGLFMNTRGELCEGTGTNVFVVKGERVLTPPVDSGCLAGITRELLLEWGLAHEERLFETDLMEADEVFLTSSTRDVHPVVALGDRIWSEVGSVAREISTQYVRNIVQNVDP